MAAVPGSLNQLTATWTPPIPKNGIITAYTVYCNTSANQVYPEQAIGPNIPTIRSVVNETMLTAIFNTGLNPFTQYNCYVTANTSVGEGPPSQVVNTKTSESGILSCVMHFSGGSRNWEGGGGGGGGERHRGGCGKEWGELVGGAAPGSVREGAPIPPS